MQVSERQIYHDIITRMWTLFRQEIPFDEFSDEWWKYVIHAFDEIREFYKGTDYSEFANKMAQNYLDEHERRAKDYGKCRRDSC